jgi:hypothetical protein
MLTPSERIRLITEIGRRLTDEGWAVIDLTLRQFDLPTTDDWRGDTNGYVIQMTERAADDVLSALAVHVGIDIGRQSVLEPTFWTKGYFRMFISHVAAMKTPAAEVQGALLKYGVSAFVAHNDIEPTREWQDEIELALSTCDSLVALLSPDFHKSKWTDQELGFAMGRGVLIMSVGLGHDPYGFIGKFQALNGSGRAVDDLARGIFDALLQHKQTRQRIKEGLVARFEQATSFQSARETMTLLEKIGDWSEPLKLRLRTAVSENYEIANAFTVPDRVKKLID